MPHRIQNLQSILVDASTEGFVVADKHGASVLGRTRWSFTRPLH